MAERVIKAVANLKDKENTYRTQKARLNLAIKQKFYFEAILIEYAIIEDRLRSYMYHIGLLQNREAFKISAKIPKRVKNEIEPIVRKYGGNDKLFSIANITGKMRILKALVIWSSNAECECDTKYLQHLKSQFQELDPDLMLETLEKISHWNDYRNEVVHALMNKNVLSLNLELEAKVVEGKQYAEILDSQLKSFKKGNVLRKMIGLPNN